MSATATPKTLCSPVTNVFLLNVSEPKFLNQNTLLSSCPVATISTRPSLSKSAGATVPTSASPSSCERWNAELSKFLYIATLFEPSSPTTMSNLSSWFMSATTIDVLLFLLLSSTSMRDQLVPLPVSQRCNPSRPPVRMSEYLLSFTSPTATVPAPVSPL